MVKQIFAVAIFLSAFTTTAQQKIQLKNGDLLFQNLDCGPLCDAIEEVTTGFNNHKFSHIGLVYIHADSIMVIEAIGKDVHLTPLSSFISRSDNAVYAARVKPVDDDIARQAVTNALQYLGIPYDDAFLYNNGKYYCSEMIYDAFKKANNNKAYFSLEPMTFCPPGKKTFYPAWKKYYKQLNQPVPQGKPGINPGGISRSKKLKILGTITSR